MASALEWSLELIDRISSPAARASQSLSAVERSLRAVDRATGKSVVGSSAAERKIGGFGRAVQAVGRTFGPRAAASTLGFARGVVTVGSAFGTAAGAARRFGDGTAKALSAVNDNAAFGFAKKLALGGALAVGGLAVVGAKYATDALQFKENTLFAFKYMTGSQEGALELFNEADTLAAKMGQKTSSIAGSLRELMTGGFDRQTALRLTAAFGDLKAINPNANIETLATQVTQMQGAGRITMEDLKPILNAGVQDRIFYTELRKLTGDRDQTSLKRAISAGKVSSDLGVQALLRSVTSGTGNKALGEAAEAFANTTTTGAFERMAAMFERLMAAINGGQAGGAFIDLMKRVTDAMDPTSESGKRTLAEINKVADAVTTMFKGFDAKTVTDGLDSIVTAVSAVVKTIQGLQGAAAWLGITGPLKTDNADHAIERGVQAEADAAYARKMAREGLALGAPMSSVANPTPGMTNVGAQAAAGLAAGLTSGGPTVEAASGALAMTAVNAAASTLEVQSPSRVFRQLGAYTGEGYALGLEAQAGRVGGAMDEMVSPPTLAPLRLGPLAPATNAKGSEGPRGGVSFGDINVQVAGAGGDPNAIAVSIRRELTSYLDGLALE